MAVDSDQTDYSLLFAVAQPPLASGDGPIALIMAPTRELVVQIGKDVKRFARQLNLTCVCAYGGAALGTQISELKRGTEARPCASALTIVRWGAPVALLLR